jgi:hypothetical protein
MKRDEILDEIELVEGDLVGIARRRRRSHGGREALGLSGRGSRGGPELSELLEGLRYGDPKSDKIPGFTSAEEEAADVLIRLLDMAHARGWRVGEAMAAKHGYNASRPHKHGTKF